MAATVELEELTIEEGRWRGRIMSAALIFLLGAFAVAAAYYFFFRDEEVAARPTEDLNVERRGIATTLLVSGVADAQLNSDLTFQSSGRVATVSARTGDVIRAGQVLATLESDDLTNAVASAQTNLRTAELKLEDLREGSTAAELASADQAVSTADAALVKARNDLQELADGPEPADVAAAQQGVATAEAQLAQAQSARVALDDTPNAADVAAAEAAVASAESALTAAENTAKNADNTVSSAAASLKSAEASYCVADNTPAFCISQSTPISASDESIVSAALNGANATLASGVISANNTYLNALNARASADAAVDSADQAVNSAEEKLAQVQAGPSSDDIASADAAVTSAQAGLTAAQEKLADAQRGATPEQVSTAQSALRSAEVSLAAAVAMRNETRRGPEANALRQASEAVRTAQLSVEAAQIRLKDTQIIAPFDGTVAVVNITPGEFVGPAATEPAIVLLTPNAMLLEMDIGETDYASMKVGLGGAVRFDGLPGRFYPFVVSELGLSPNIEQGVVTYPVKATLIVTGDAPRPVPGMNASGQLTLSTRDNVLAIPARAIRRRGTEQVVDVRRDGAIVEQVITTGVSDIENVEVLTGLEEGDVLVVPALRGAEDEEEDAVPTIPGGIR